MADILSSTIMKMVTADRIRDPFFIEWESTYDPQFLAEVVTPALRGGSYAPLTDRTPSILDRFRGRRADKTETTEIAATVERYRSWVAKPDRWRYEALAQDGTLARAYGCDGRLRWQLVNGRVHINNVHSDHAAHQLGDGDWQQMPDAAARELLDPSLVLAVLSIATTETVGGVLRLTGNARNADLFESSLVSPWAAVCRVDVDPASGLVLAAINVDDIGRTVRQYVVTRLDVAGAIDDDVFAPPSS